MENQKLTSQSAIEAGYFGQLGDDDIKDIVSHWSEDEKYAAACALSSKFFHESQAKAVAMFASVGRSKDPEMSQLHQVLSKMDVNTLTKAINAMSALYYETQRPEE